MPTPITHLCFALLCLVKYVQMIVNSSLGKRRYANLKIRQFRPQPALCMLSNKLSAHIKLTPSPLFSLSTIKMLMCFISVALLFVTVNIYWLKNPIWPPSESVGYITSTTCPNHGMYCHVVYHFPHFGGQGFQF